jgi:hypothetical protein
VDISDFLIVLAGAAGDALATPDLLGKSPIKEGYWTRFVAFLKRTNINLPQLTADDVVKARVHGDALRLFGTEERLRKVILASGGHLRDLLRIVGEVILRAGALPVDDATVDAAIDQLRWELLPVSDENARWLARIARTHEASLEDDKHLPVLAHFLDTGLVLCYRDGPEWYDVHPLIRQTVIDQTAKLDER